MGRGALPMRGPKAPFRLAITARSAFGISPSFLGLSQSSGQVTHVLLTRSRLCPRPKPGSSLHLHVLGTPPAFVLSQDQTLREELLNFTKESSGVTRYPRRPESRRLRETLGLSLEGSGPCVHTGEPSYTVGSGTQDGVNSGTA